MFGHRAAPLVPPSSAPPYPHPLPVREPLVAHATPSALAQLEHIGKQRTKEIRAGTELRMTVGADEDLFLKAHSRIPDTFATAEIFGMELVMGHEYRVDRGLHVAIFTWHGCTIEMRGATSVEYDASNQVMRDYTNIAGIMEQKRQLATEQAAMPPPRILITGSEHSGKSTLALFLSNYALRKHRRPICVELDPGSLSCHRQLPSIPGSVSAIQVDHSAYELNQEPVHPHRTNLHKGIDQGSIAAHLNPNYPIGKSIGFWYGYEDWRRDPELFRKCIGQLSCLVQAKEEMNNAQVASEKVNANAVSGDGINYENLAKGGLIVNAPSNPTPELIDEIISLYNINVVIVIEDDDKYMHLINRYCGGVVPTVPTRGDDGIVRGATRDPLVFLDAMEEDEGEAGQLDVVHVAKAGGVIENTTPEWRNRMLHMKMADYFHGPDRDLVCHNFAIPLRELFVVKIESVNTTSEDQTWNNKFKVVPYDDIPGKLRHSVLAIVLAPSLEEIVFSTISGLVWVRDVSDPEDVLNAHLHLMCPSATPMMSNYLVYGDLDNLKYFEQ